MKNGKAGSELSSNVNGVIEETANCGNVAIITV